ncbi:MAG: DMT family transporter [Alphaproteobacteria bacterium]
MTLQAMSPRVEALLAAAAAAGMGSFVGAAMVASRFAIAETEPASLAFMRYLIGAAFLLPAVAMGQRPRFEPSDWLPICLLGIAQFGILIALLNFALQFIPAGLGALLFATVPLLAMGLATLLRIEPLTRWKTTGVLLTIVGVGLALGERLALPKSDMDTWLGIAAALAAAFTGALCSVLYRPYLAKYPALPVSFVAMLASVAFLAVLAAFEGFFDQVPDISVAAWGAVVFVGFASAAGYWLWLWALQHATPTRVTVFIGLGPVVAAILGAALLGEVVTPALVAGVAAVLLGLWAANR